MIYIDENSKEIQQMVLQTGASAENVVAFGLGLYKSLLDNSIDNTAVLIVDGKPLEIGLTLNANYEILGKTTPYTPE